MVRKSVYQIFTVFFIIAFLVLLYFFFQKSRKEFVFTIPDGDYFGVLRIKGYLHPFILKVENEKIKVENSQAEKDSYSIILKSVGNRIVAVNEGARFIFGRGEVSEKEKTSYARGTLYSLVSKARVGSWIIWKLNYLRKKEGENSPYFKLVKYHLSLRKEIESLEINKNRKSKVLSMPLIKSGSVSVKELYKIKEETKKLNSVVKELREKIALSMTVTKAGQIVSLSRRVKEYNDRWLSSMIKSLPEQTIAVNSSEYEQALKLFNLFKELKEEEKKVNVLREFYDKER